MQHNGPHNSAAFEGYYSKFDLSAGGKLALIVCTVRNGRYRKHMLSLTFVPGDGGDVFQKEIWLEEVAMTRLHATTEAFELSMPGIGHVRWNDDTFTEYAIDHESFSFHATTSSRVPWSPGHQNSTPEGLLVQLPLPLHWHVHSLASQCVYRMAFTDYALPSRLSAGTAVVHQEKNWGNSFPSAHTWLQARSGERTLCCAGGKILGLEAFLVGYNSPDLKIAFTPPFALRVGAHLGFMSCKCDWQAREMRLEIQSFRWKIVIEASAPVGSFFSLSAPFPEGHRENFLAESFDAIVNVRIYKSGWISPFRLVRTDVFKGASLEFAGEYYPPAGGSVRFH